MPACSLCGIFYGGRGGGDLICSNCHASTHEEVRRRNPGPASSRPASRYRATRTFVVSGTEIVIREGDEVLFDGTRVGFLDELFADGRQQVQEMPQIRGAIEAGWLVLDEPTTGWLVPDEPATVRSTFNETLFDLVTGQVLVDDKPVGQPFKIPKPKVERVRPTRYDLIGEGGLDLGDEPTENDSPSRSEAR